MGRDVLTLEQLQAQLKRHEAFLRQLEQQEGDHEKEIRQLKKDIHLTRLRIDKSMGKA